MFALKNLKQTWIGIPRYAQDDIPTFVFSIYARCDTSVTQAILACLHTKPSHPCYDLGMHGSTNSTRFFYDYLCALGDEVADPVKGFFGPESSVWQINREAVLMLGGMRALLMQIAHPKVAQGVADHSRFRQEPFKRALRTFDAVHAMVFGTREEAINAATRVHAVHTRVQGMLSDSIGSRYAANDPDLLLWVYATLFDSALRSYELFVAPMQPDARERFYRDGMRFAQLFGIDPACMPATYTDFDRWMVHMIESETINVTSAGREIGRVLLKGPSFFRIASPLNTVLAAGMLHPKLREAFDLKWHRPVRTGYTVSVNLIRLIVRITPRSLRALPNARRAERRCAQTSL